MAEGLPALARVKLGLVLATLLILHTTVMTQLRLFGIMPDVMLLTSIAAALVGGPALGAQVGFAAGMASDLFLATPMGLSALTFCLVAYATGLVSSGLQTSTRILVAGVAAGASAAGVVLFALFWTMLGGPHVLSLRLVLVVLVVAVVNAAMSPLAVRALRWSVRGSTRLGALA